MKKFRLLPLLLAALCALSLFAACSRTYRADRSDTENFLTGGGGGLIGALFSRSSDENATIYLNKKPVFIESINDKQIRLRHYLTQGLNPWSMAALEKAEVSPGKNELGITLCINKGTHGNTQEYIVSEESVIFAIDAEPGHIYRLRYEILEDGYDAFGEEGKKDEGIRISPYIADVTDEEENKDADSGGEAVVIAPAPGEKKPFFIVKWEDLDLEPPETK